MSRSAGIDYGHGMTNIDNATGIRYGVIAQGSVLQAWADSAEPDYGEPTCPRCGNRALDSGSDEIPPTEKREHWTYEGNDFACLHCERTFWADAAYSDEPAGWQYEGDGYSCVDCLDTNIMVLKSPFYTYARFCSPCVPGAGDLDNWLPEHLGVKTYCLGHDWFDDGRAPYPVFSVETNERIEP